MQTTLVSSNIVDEGFLSTIELPEKTKSYVPVSHSDFVDNVKDIASRMMPSHELHVEKYGIARDGKQMFGTLTYKQVLDSSLNPINDLGLSIGIRNSYDKSMSLGICSGASVFVCENLMMSGEIVVMRTHRGRILDELKGLIFNAIANAEGKFHTLHSDSLAFKSEDCNNDMAFGMIGRLYGRGVLRERQLPVVKKEWLNPKHEAFSDRNAWGLYNACTEALKTTPPMFRMNNQIKLHEQFKSEFGIA
tara:strand:+ start:13272 stop:14015 length:744 start_codon:yes stop_codon:yes gene_type:complete